MEEEIDLLLFVEEKRKDGKQEYCDADITVGYVEYREVDEFEIQEINHISVCDPVNHVADGTCHNHGKADANRKHSPVGRNCGVFIQDENKYQNSDAYQSQTFPLEGAECGAVILGVRELKHTGNQWYGFLSF